MLRQIADFAADVRFDDLPEFVLHAARERLLDAVGCAMGALGCETAAIGHAVASRAATPARSGRVIGSAQTLSAASATFINGCLIRDLDFNDTYPGGHPSDSLAAPLAVGPQHGSSGADLVTAAVIAYEIFIRIQMAGQLREKGWDNGFGIGVGTSAALARLMGLDRERTTHAIALTATSNVPMRATRAGTLSMWKGAATAFATQSAVVATQLAAAGMTGPEAPFTGRHGLADLITGPVELRPFGTAGGDYVMPLAKIKYWPVVYNMQALVWCAIGLREKLEGREVASVEVKTYWSAWHESGSEPAKWDPRTRETADHSLPYILAWTLRHGSIGPEAFVPGAYLDETLRPVMNRVTVAVDDEIERDFPAVVRMRMRATDVAGNTHDIEVVNPLGHEANPVSSAELAMKFRRLCTGTLSPEAIDTALAMWWSIEKHTAQSLLDCLVLPLSRPHTCGHRYRTQPSSNPKVDEP
jgi:2-methylcitrate dehydratase